MNKTKTAHTATCAAPKYPEWLIIRFSFLLFFIRTIRVWLRRDSGQYWPSICQYMPSGCTAIEYMPETRQVFIGQDNGTVSQYALSDDCNRLTLIRDFLSHQGRVTGVCYAKNSGWVLSCGRDKLFAFHAAETGTRLGGYTFEAICTALQYPFYHVSVCVCVHILYSF